MTRTKVANDVETQINNYSIRFVSQLFEILDEVILIMLSIIEHEKL